MRNRIPYEMTTPKVSGSVTMVEAPAPTTTTSAAAEASATTMKTTSKHHINLFDLANVGLSSTLAIAVFIGIGYVVRHVAGPSALISVLVAAIIAYLVGKSRNRNSYSFIVLNGKMTRKTSNLQMILSIKCNTEFDKMQDG